MEIVEIKRDDDQKDDLKTVEVWTALITNDKMISKVIVKINSACPSSKLSHVKRIKNIQGRKRIFLAELSILQTLDEVNQFLVDICVCEYLSDFEVIRVPAYAVSNDEAWRQWQTIWPIARAPVDPESTKEEFWSEDDIRRIGYWMNVAESEAKVAGEHNNVPIGIAIVDPSTNQLIIKSHDERPIHCMEKSMCRIENHGFCDETKGKKIHPLKHAVISAVEKVGEYHSKNEESYRKRKFSSNEEMPYLCTSYDIYITNEPCVFCSMALVHSRISRVFFLNPSPYGGLSKKYFIHARKELNHHFKVYRVIQKLSSIVGLS